MIAVAIIVADYDSIAARDKAEKLARDAISAGLVVYGAWHALRPGPRLIDASAMAPRKVVARANKVWIVETRGSRWRRPSAHAEIFAMIAREARKPVRYVPIRPMRLWL